MNEEQAENEFQVGLRTLLEDIEKEVSPDAPDPYAGGDRQASLCKGKHGFFKFSRAQPLLTSHTIEDQPSCR